MADIVNFGSDAPHWRPSRRLPVVGLVMLPAAGAAAAAVAAFGDRGMPGPIAPSVVGPVPAPETGQPCVPVGWAQRPAAVVTFPVGAPAGRHWVKVGERAGVAQQGMVTWPVAEAHTRIRGICPRPD